LIFARNGGLVRANSVRQD